MLLSSILFLMKVKIQIIHQCMIDYHLWKSIYHIFLFVASYRDIEEEIIRSSELIVFGPLYDGRQHKIWSIWYPNDMRLCPPHIKCLRTFEVLISNVYAKGIVAYQNIITLGPIVIQQWVETYASKYIPSVKLGVSIWLLKHKLSF